MRQGASTSNSIHQQLSSCQLTSVSGRRRGEGSAPCGATAVIITAAGVIHPSAAAYTDLCQLKAIITALHLAAAGNSKKQVLLERVAAKLHPLTAAAAGDGGQAAAAPRAPAATAAAAAAVTTEGRQLQLRELPQQLQQQRQLQQRATEGRQLQLRELPQQLQQLRQPATERRWLQLRDPRQQLSATAVAVAAAAAAAAAAFGTADSSGSEPPAHCAGPSPGDMTQAQRLLATLLGGAHLAGSSTAAGAHNAWGATHMGGESVAAGGGSCSAAVDAGGELVGAWRKV